MSGGVGQGLSISVIMQPRVTSYPAGLVTTGLVHRRGVPDTPDLQGETFTASSRAGLLGPITTDILGQTIFCSERLACAASDA